MKRTMALLLVLALSPIPALAQVFSYDDSWAGKPSTVALQEVRAAIDAGKCGTEAVDFINTRGHVAAVFVAAGHAGPWGVVQWYDKPNFPGDKCGASKFQFFGVDGPYPQGWEAGLWSLTWTANDPPKWRLNPYAPPTSGPVMPPPPVVTPPPAPLPSLDFGLLYQRFDLLEANIKAAIKADGDQTRAEAKTNWDGAKRAFYAITKYVGPAIAAWIAAKKS